MKTAYIVGAGAFTARGFHPGRKDLVIAADGGYEALKQKGIRPHLVLGDMDSIRALPRDIARLRFPVKKDLTDLALAIRLLRGQGFDRFKLYGAGGGRMDHTLANLQLLLSLANEGCDARLVDPGYTATAIHQSRLTLPPLTAGTLVSVFALAGTARGVRLRGLAYPLTAATLTPFDPLGVSNQAVGQPIQIRVREGSLLVLVMHRSKGLHARNR